VFVVEHSIFRWSTHHERRLHARERLQLTADTGIARHQPDLDPSEIIGLVGQTAWQNVAPADHGRAALADVWRAATAKLRAGLRDGISPGTRASAGIRERMAATVIGRGRRIRCRHIATLSRGMRQQLGLEQHSEATGQRAPSLVLLDEPWRA
jgi:hypothetical protein